MHPCTTLHHPATWTHPLLPALPPQECDKVELIFTKFVSLIASTPTIQTLLPLTPTGELCDIDGNCVDAGEDEIFRLTTAEGKLGVAVEKVSVETPEMDPSLLFEQDPVQILDALLPLYLNSCLLRSLQVRPGALLCDEQRCLRVCCGRACCLAAQVDGVAASCVCKSQHPHVTGASVLLLPRCLVLTTPCSPSPLPAGGPGLGAGCPHERHEQRQ